MWQMRSVIAVVYVAIGAVSCVTASTPGFGEGGLGEGGASQAQTGGSGNLATGGSGSLGSGANGTGTGASGVGASGNGAAPACVADDFDTGALSATWTKAEDYDATIAVNGGQLQLDILTGATQSRFAAVKSATFSLEACGALVEVVDASQQGGMEVGFSVRNDDWNWVGFRQSSNRLELIQTVSNVEDVVSDIAYSPSSHRWWRIHKEAGNFHWMTSPDGNNWNELNSAAAAIPEATLSIRLHAMVEPGTQNGSAAFDNVNTPTP